MAAGVAGFGLSFLSMPTNGARQGKNGTARRDILLPAWHDDAVNQRMKEQGICRSEAVRGMIRDAVHQRGHINRFALKRLVGILRLNVAAIRLTPSKIPDVLRSLDCAIEELDKLADA